MVRNLCFITAMKTVLCLSWSYSGVQMLRLRKQRGRAIITAPHWNICSAVSALPLRNSLRQSMLEPDNFFKSRCGRKRRSQQEENTFQ